MDNIQKKYEADLRKGKEQIPYTPEEFETDISKWLDLVFPFSSLPGIRVFSPHRRIKTDYGIEVDHLLHFNFGVSDFIIVIEAKKQTVQVEGGK